MPVDLTYGRRVLEAEMTDTCRITRDPQQEDDDTFNRVTGEYAPPVGDVTTVYDAASVGSGGRALTGRCMVTLADRVPGGADVGGDPVSLSAAKALLPWDAPLPAVGDLLEMVTSRRDPALVGQQFTVEEVEQSTFMVGRQLRLQKVARAVHRR
jgi:hypothetical protein